jgi:plastocyanin
MHLIRRLGVAATAFGLVTAAAGFLPARAASIPPVSTIGIDNAGPSGHNWEFLDYYPRAAADVLVHNGTVIHFKFNTASADGFHTATLGACRDQSGSPVACPTAGGSTETAGQIQLNYPQIVPDNDSGSTVGDLAGQRLSSNKVFNSTNPPAGSGAPGACGDLANPCPWDGSKELNSGALFNGGPNGVNGTDYFFQVQVGTLTQPLTVNYYCAVHGPTMKGSFTVVPNATTASTQADLDTAAAAQYAPQTAQGTSAEAAASAAAITTNSNGTKTYALTAGTESLDGHVQVLEMLPQSINITAGDTVHWASKTGNDPHTVTFPDGPLANPVDPFGPGLCEDAITGDGPATFGPSGPCGGNPNAFETHYNSQPQGATAIASATTVGTSGVIEAANSGYEQIGPSFSFSFPNAGTFTYACGIHTHMTGVVKAAAFVAPVLPAAGAPAPATGRNGSGFETTLLALLIVSCLMVGRGLVVLLRRQT